MHPELVGEVGAAGEAAVVTNLTPAAAERRQKDVAENEEISPKPFLAAAQSTSLINSPVGIIGKKTTFNSFQNRSGVKFIWFYKVQGEVQGGFDPLRQI